MMPDGRLSNYLVVIAMRDEEYWKNKYELAVTEETLDMFCSVPRKAQMILLREMLFDKTCNEAWACIVLQYCKRCESEIEVIFRVACEIVAHKTRRWNISININPQVETMTENKYRADFMFCSEDMNRDDAVYEPFELVIECDGHDFHSSKEQIRHDNERDMDLRMSGYDVIHFSGSQIYNDPLGCADAALTYIESKLKPKKETGGDNNETDQENR
jgi:very-short-patch-repair endonuclease